MALIPAVDEDGQIPIPADLYDAVLQLVFDMFNASEAEDQREYWAAYNRLQDYVHAQVAAGRDHPYLWESLADSTRDDRASLPYYHRALNLAKSCGARYYLATIQLELARRFRTLGQEDEAMRHAWAANEVARDLSDLDVRRDISRFLAGEENA